MEQMKTKGLYHIYNILINFILIFDYNKNNFFNHKN